MYAHITLKTFFQGYIKTFSNYTAFGLYPFTDTKLDIIATVQIVLYLKRSVWALQWNDSKRIYIDSLYSALFCMLYALQ